MAKPFRQWQRRFLYFLIVFSLIAATIVFVIKNNKDFKNTISQQWNQQMEYTTALACLNVESFLEKYSDNLKVIARNYKVLSYFDSSPNSGHESDNSCYLCNLYEIHKKDVEGIYLIDTMSNILVSFPDNYKRKHHFDMKKAIEYFRNEANAEIFIDIDFHPKSQSSFVYIIVPVFQNNVLNGVLLWEISIQNIVNKYINPFIDAEKTGYLWLIDSSLNILSHHDNNYSGLNAHYILKDFEITGKVGNYSAKNSFDYIQHSKSFFQQIKISNQGQGNYIDFAHAKFSFAFFRKINLINQSWTIILSIPYSTIFEPVRKNSIKTYFYEFVFVLLLLLITYIFFRLEQKSIRLQKETEYAGMLARSAEELQFEKQKRLTALIDGQEKERSRISREIHDGMGQRLLAVKLKLENLKNIIHHSEIEETFNMVQQSISDAKNISNDLAPVEMQEFGIESALKNLSHSFEKNTGIKVDYVSYGMNMDLNINTKTYLYRIVQEAFSNIIKHSKATMVNLQLLGNNEQLTLVIQDNGVGFEYNQDARKRGNGLNNIIERVNILKAEFEIASIKKQGTTITIKIKN